MTSDGPFTVICLQELKIANHNHWKSDPYPTLISTIHESPCIELCVCARVCVCVCEIISNVTFVELWYETSSFTVMVSQTLGLVEKVFDRICEDVTGGSRKLHKKTIIIYAISNNSGAKSKGPKYSTLVMQISELRGSLKILARRTEWGRSRKTLMTVE